MSSLEAVTGCSTCGALYTPISGDQGLCTTCRSLLPYDPPSPSADSSPGPRSAPARRRASRPAFRWERSIQRIATGLVVLVLVGGLGSAIAFRRQKLTEVWHAIRRGSPSEAWAGTERLALEGWSAVRRQIPIGARASEAQKPDEARGSHKRAKVARK